MARFIVIKSAIDGFRRCGIAHPAAQTSYPFERFTKEELDALGAEPVLMVGMKEVPDDDDNDDEERPVIPDNTGGDTPPATADDESKAGDAPAADAGGKGKGGKAGK